MVPPKTVLMDLSSIDPGVAPHHNLQALSWPTCYSTYTDISKKLIETVLTQLTNIQDDETNCAILRAKAYDIICDLSLLLRIAIDITEVRKAGLRPIYDEVASPMLHYLDMGTNPYHFPIPRIWHHPIDKRFVKRASNTARRFRSHLRSLKAGSNRIDIHNRNNLVNELLLSTATSYVDWPVADIDWRRSTLLPTTLEDSAVELCRSVCQAVEGQIAEQSIQVKFQKLGYRLIAFHLSKAHADFSVLERHINARPNAATLLSGTPKHLGRLASWLYRREGAKTIRCAHGGERVFFVDAEWGLAEFPDCDTYYTHGKAERDTLERRINQNLVPTANMDSHISFKTIGSSHHQNLHDYTKKYRAYPATGEVLYVAGGYLGEAFGDFTSRKPPDPLYLDYQIDLLQKLKALGYRVTVKSHPGGIISNGRFLSRYAEQVLDGYFNPATSTGDCFIFDFAGTAFVDALASGRPMVLADMGVRPFDDTVFKELSARCPIIPSGINEEGRFRVQTEALGSAITRSMETEPTSFIDFHRKFFAA